MSDSQLARSHPPRCSVLDVEVPQRPQSMVQEDLTILPLFARSVGPVYDGASGGFLRPLRLLTLHLLFCRGVALCARPRRAFPVAARRLAGRALLTLADLAFEVLVLALVVKQSAICVVCKNFCTITQQYYAAGLATSIT